jgi:hypothetical protein
VFDGGFNCFLGLDMGFGCCECYLAGRVCRVVLLFLGSGFVRALLYTDCTYRGALHFFNKVALLLIKKILT